MRGRWKWDEDANALTPDGAALQLEGDGLWSLAAAPGPGYGAPMKLLAGCGDGILRALGNGACGALQQQAALVGHSEAVTVVIAMNAVS